MTGWKRDACIGAVAGLVAVAAAVIVAFGLFGTHVPDPIKQTLIMSLVPGYGLVLVAGQLVVRVVSRSHSDLVFYLSLVLQTLTNALVYSAAWLVIQRAGRRSRAAGFVTLVLLMALFVAVALPAHDGLMLSLVTVSLVGSWLLLFRTETANNWGLSTARWEAGLHESLKWQWRERYMASSAYRRDLRICGVILLLMAVAMILAAFRVPMPTW